MTASTPLIENALNALAHAELDRRQMQEALLGRDSIEMDLMRAGVMALIGIANLTQRQTGALVSQAVAAEKLGETLERLTSVLETQGKAEEEEEEETPTPNDGITAHALTDQQGRQFYVTLRKDGSISFFWWKPGNIRAIVLYDSLDEKR